jgi:hypothetical protein
MGRLQILEHLRDSTDALLQPKMNADGEAIERWDALQEIGDPNKAAHAMACFEREGRQ